MLALQELLVFCRSTLRDFFDVAQSSFAVLARTGSYRATGGQGIGEQWWMRLAPPISVR